MKKEYPKKLTKKNLIEFIVKSFEEEDKSGEWDKGYDACLETLGQEFLTDKELTDVFHGGQE